MSWSLHRYREQGVFDGLAVHFAKTIAKLSPESDPLVLLGAALAMRAPLYGHVAVDLERVSQDIRVEGITTAELTWPDPEIWRDALSSHPLVRSPSSERVTPLLLDGSLLYLDRYWGYQARLIQAITQRLQAASLPVEEAKLEESLGRLFTTNGPDDQRDAARSALTRHITFVIGGPGTGKTTTVKRILALLLEHTPNPETLKIALMAPTGKAAARLRDSIIEGLEHLPISETIRSAMPNQASTIHRSLGTRPRQPTRFRHHAGNPLNLDVVVVDEASMVDLALMVKLLEALSPSCKIILLGDANQLQSVEAGAVLGDICRADMPELVCELSTTYRFGSDSGIGSLSRSIQRGAMAQSLAYLQGKTREGGGDDAYDDLQWIETDGRAGSGWEAHLESLVVSALRPCIEACQRGAFADALRHLDDLRILCAHRRGRRGVSGINSVIERWLRRGGLIAAQGEYYVGRPLMIQRNDHVLGLYNGDVGVVVRVSPEEALVAFPASNEESYRVIPVSRIPAHETVFAMTIHKSQGSQLSHAVVILPEQGSRLLTRELLYTAVTRARHRLTLVGSAEVLEQALIESLPRTSGITQGLNQRSGRVT